MDRLKKVTIGAGRDDGEMVMGPMISFRERDRVLDLIADAKARGARYFVAEMFLQALKRALISVRQS